MFMDRSFLFIYYTDAVKILTTVGFIDTSTTNMSVLVNILSL